jgi:hypothetical protein
MDELYIEFDGQQVTVRTDVAEMRDYLARTYQPMLADRRKSSISFLEVTGVEGGYSVRGASELDFRGKIASLYDHVKNELLFQFIRERQDLLWLHAGAVERHGQALLVAGPSGQGKSTLSTLLCERGWNFMSDDIAPVRMSSDEVLAFPLAPFRRVATGRRVARRNLGTLSKEMVSIPAHSIRREAATIGRIVFPTYRARARPKLTRLASGNAAFELLRSYTNFVDHKASGVARAAELARTIPAYELVYGNGEGAANLLDSSH